MNRSSFYLKISVGYLKFTTNFEKPWNLLTMNSSCLNHFYLNLLQLNVNKSTLLTPVHFYESALEVLNLKPSNSVANTLPIDRFCVEDIFLKDIDFKLTERFNAFLFYISIVFKLIIVRVETSFQPKLLVPFLFLRQT